MSESFFPGAFVLNALCVVEVLALAVAQTIQHLAFVGRLVWPVVRADSCNLVLTEFALVDSAVCPLEGSFAMEQPVSELAFVLMTILEVTLTLTMVHFTNLTVFLVVNNVASPSFDDELRQLGRQECNFW